ncbi:MAG: glycosyltransferase family 4 protein [Nitrososphaerales archaeon]
MVFNLLAALRDDRDVRVAALALNEGVLTSRLRDAGIEVHVVPEATHSFPMVFMKALKILNGKEVKVIHSHRYKENLLAVLLARPNKVRRLVTTLHGLGERCLGGENGKHAPGVKRHIDYFLLKHHFARVVAVSNEMANALIQKYGFRQEQLDVIHNGINTEAAVFSPSHSDDHRFHVGTAGRLVPVKDFRLFLEVAARLKAQCGMVRFSILGDGPLKGELRRVARDLRIEDSVEFLPFREDPMGYYRSLDLFLNTSLHEGSPISILEAMGCGKVVVAPRVGGISEIIEHGKHGLLADSREPSEFARLCMKLIGDKELMRHLGRSSARRVRASFDSLTMANSYKRLYRQ